MKLPILSTPTLIPLAESDKDFLVKKAYLSVGSRNQQVAIIEVVHKTDNKTIKLLSAGKSTLGCLGQGQDIKESDIFKDVKFNPGLDKIAQVELAPSHAMILTTSG